MSTGHNPGIGLGGFQHQSAFPSFRASDKPHPGAVLVRGVVIAVYTFDNPDGSAVRARRVTYCDVRTYSQIPQLKTNIITRVLVNTTRGGIHEGRAWTPRAATFDLSTRRRINPQEAATLPNPATLDGDHVLVGFMDNTMSLPVIITGIPHPAADTGFERWFPTSDNEDPFSNLEERADEDSAITDFVSPSSLAEGGDTFKHRGVVYGVNGFGNFLVDAVNGNEGSLEPDGSQRVAEGDNGGSITLDARDTVSASTPGSQLRMDDDGLVYSNDVASIYAGTDRLVISSALSRVELTPETITLVREFEDPLQDPVTVVISDTNVSVTGPSLNLNINGQAAQDLLRGTRARDFLSEFVNAFNSHTHTLTRASAPNGPLAGTTDGPAGSLSVPSDILNPDVKTT